MKTSDLSTAIHGINCMAYKTCPMMEKEALSLHSLKYYRLSDTRFGNNSSSADEITNSGGDLPGDLSDTSIRRKIWGKQARNALLLGAYSYHMSGTGDLTGNGQHNERNHLLALQLHGLTLGTFINSFDDRTYYAGWAREVYGKSLTDDVRFDVGYQFGLCYGYKGEILNADGYSPFALAMVGVTWKNIGLHFGVMPFVLIAASLRINLGI